MDLFGDLPDPNSSKTVELTVGNQTSPEKTLSNRHGEKRKSQGNGDSNDEVSEAKRKEYCGPEDGYYAFDLHGYMADRQGEREDMQDAHVVIDDFCTQFSDLHPSIYRLALYAVFDGHGGVRASRFASQHLHTNLRDKFPKGDAMQVEKEIKKVFIEAFKKTDEDFLKEAGRNKPSWKDGTTAVMVLAINDTLYIANLGDSKAILCRYKESEGKCVGIPLTKDHNPSVYEERMRIQKAGGIVREGRVMGVLEVARSIGDGPYKNHGVTCIPDIKRCQLTENDRYIMIACDGLWKSYSVDASIQFVNKILEDTSLTSAGKKTAEDMRFDAACSKLANSAVLKLSGDNVTILIVSVRGRNKIKR